MSELIDFNEQNMETALFEIAKRLGYVESLKELMQITELSEKEIKYFSLLLTIADNLKFNDFWELPFELDLGSSALYKLTTYILAMKISKKRKSRKELLDLIERANAGEQSRFEMIKRLFSRD